MLAAPPARDDEVRCLSLVKWPVRELYAVLYRPARRDEALRQIGRWASDPDLSFTWYDAAVLSSQVRRS